MLKLTVPALTLASLLIAPAVLADHAGNGKAAGDQQKVVADMTRVAQAFVATVQGKPSNVETAVGYDRKALVGLVFDDNARTNYVYWPYLRKGLPIDFMTAEQRSLLHDMLNTALSSKGYLSALQVMQMEKILQDTETTGFPRGTENYTLAIFGEPAIDHTWGWRFEGHHLSLNFTVAPGEVSVTPTFFGASPAKIESGVLAGFRNQRPVHEAGFALVNSLDDKQKAIAIAAGAPPFDIVSGNLNKPATTWDDWKKQAPQGIEVKTLSAAQKDLAQRILDEVVTVYRPEISKAYLQQIDVNDLRFVWFGGTTEKDAHYYRLEGKDFWFEYDLVQGNGNHVHAVWRSKSGDFGGDLLALHHQQSH
ncbi:MAG TPA: DUF3500 domain-containing protein [Candidatus Acidoferrum sp.]|nr:DUF3500 domain-containing protein [Candidatus Acidoferrum sp.]